MTKTTFRKIIFCSVFISLPQLSYCCDDILDLDIKKAQQSFIASIFESPCERVFKILRNVMSSKPQIIEFNDSFIDLILPFFEKPDLESWKKTDLTKTILKHPDYANGVLEASNATPKQKKLNSFLKNRLNGFHLPKFDAQGNYEDHYDDWRDSEATIMKCNWRLLLMPQNLSDEQMDEHDDFLSDFLSDQANMEHTDIDYTFLKRILEDYDNPHIEEILWENYEKIKRVNNGDFLPDLAGLDSHIDHTRCRCWMFDAWINSSVTLTRKNYKKFFSISSLHEHKRRRNALKIFFEEERFLETDLLCEDILSILSLTGAEIAPDPWVSDMLLQFFTQFTYLGNVLIFEKLQNFLEVFAHSSVVLNNAQIMIYITQYLKEETVPLSQKQKIVSFLRKNKGHKSYYMNMQGKTKARYAKMLHDIEHPLSPISVAQSSPNIDWDKLEEDLFLPKASKPTSFKKQRKKKERVLNTQVPITQTQEEPKKPKAKPSVIKPKTHPKIQEVEKVELPTTVIIQRKTKNQQRFETFLTNAQTSFDQESYIESIHWYDKLFGLKHMAPQRMINAGDVYKKFIDLDTKSDLDIDQITNALLSSKHFFQDVVFEDELVVQNAQNMQNKTSDEQLATDLMNLPRQFSKLSIWMQRGIDQNPSKDVKRSSTANIHGDSA